MIRTRVRELGEAQGWTAARLARRADLGYTTVLRLWRDETDNPDVKTLAALGRVLGVKVGELLIEEAFDRQEDGRVVSATTTA